MSPLNYRILAIGIFLSVAISYINGESRIINYKNSALFEPDSINDSSGYIFGDTIEAIISGLDTTYLLYDDSLENMFVYNLQTVYLKPSSTPKTVNQGLYGINVSSMFDHTPEENNTLYEETENPWDLLSELKPKVLRFPDGAGGKFSRLLGSENLNSDDEEDYQSWNGGYGINLTEIIPYFDITDGTINHADWTAVEVVALDPLEPSDWTWVYSDDIPEIIQLRQQYINQVKYDPSLFTDYAGQEDEPLYINQFINLVKQIETDNSYTVDVIVCLDIINETADQCMAIIDYLRDNEIWSVNVVGVELGNEVYSNFYARAIGFDNVPGPMGTGKTAFEHYWDYVTGGDYFALAGEFDLTDVLPDALEVTDAHDFLTVLNSDETLKIGIPAKNLGGEHPFFTGNDINNILGGGAGGGAIWNSDLVDHYNETIDGIDGYAFDAVILHPYYSATNNDDTNWGDIPLCLDADAGGDFDYFDDEWDFASYDENLRCAFDGIIGVDDITGNFRELILHRIQDNYFDLNGNLNFDETNDWKKELWTTEWNLLDALDPGSLLEDQLRTSIFTNSFVHDYLLQEWFLRNVKNNHNPAIGNENFFTYATLQNFAGGSTLDLLSPADKQDQLELGVNADCMDASISDYYVARATYFDMFLLKEISANNLDYLPVTGLIFSGNLNITPTIFITESRRQLYVYYSNVKGSTQNYVINPENLGNFFVDEIGVYLTEDPTNIYSVDADQLYSTSGRSTVFEIDNYYDDCENIPYYDNRFEIRETSFEENDPSCSGTIPAGGVCVTVPAHSVGYFVVPITPFWYKMGELSNMFSLYPNPASTFFTIHHQADFADIQEVLKLEVYNSLGNEIFKTETSDGKIVDISNLPVGVYFVKIFNKYNKTEIEQFVKMK